VRLLLILALVACAGRARAESDNEAVAKQRYEAAEKLVAVGRFDDALAEYAEALRLAGYPALLQRMAYCHDRLGHSAQALDLYRRFLAADPATPRRVTVEERIGELEAKLDAEARAKAAGAPPQPSRRRFLTPALVLGAAVVVGAVGAGLYASARSDYDDLVAHCRPCQPSDWASAEARANASYALFAIAGAAAAVDVVLWALAARPRHAPASASLRLSPIGVMGRF
jgi:tetratricopeptide (TPR) repeat protein